MPGKGGKRLGNASYRPMTRRGKNARMPNRTLNMRRGKGAAGGRGK